MIGLNHCPICWDSYEICKCSDLAKKNHEEDLKAISVKPISDQAFTDGWNSCKKEVLNILSNNVMVFVNGQTYFDYLRKITSEIEKL